MTDKRTRENMAAHIRECYLCADRYVEAATRDERLEAGKLVEYVQDKHRPERLDTPAFRTALGEVIATMGETVRTKAGERT